MRDAGVARGSRRRVLVVCGFEAVAAAGGGDLQVEGGVFGVGAVVEHGFGGFALGADFDEFGVGGMFFAEVGTEAALTVVKL
jgi:hypothetical protein